MSETKNIKFITQLDELHGVESWGGTADYIYFRHESPKENSLPVLVAGGWSEGTQSLRDTAQVIFEDGREVILVDHARSGGPKADEIDYGFTAEETTTADLSTESSSLPHPEAVHKAQSLLNILDDAGLETVDVIAHSEGTINAVLAATLQPERFRNIILVAPAGMIGNDSIPRLIGRFIPKVVRGATKDMREIKQRDPESAKRFAKSGPDYLKNNPRKAIQEIGAIAHSRIDQQLADLRKAGVHIGLLQSHSDRGFPDSRINSHVVINKESGNVDAYASVAAKDAGHDDLIIHPGRSTRAALDILATLENLE